MVRAKKTDSQRKPVATEGDPNEHSSEQDHEKVTAQTSPVRKRGRPAKKDAKMGIDATEEGDDDSSGAKTAENVSKAAGRGRPKKETTTVKEGLKKARPAKKAADSVTGDAEEHPPKRGRAKKTVEAEDKSDEAPLAEKKTGRGRPKKDSAPQKATAATKNDTESVTDDKMANSENPAPKKKGGRPKKVQTKIQEATEPVEAELPDEVDTNQDNEDDAAEHTEEDPQEIDEEFPIVNALNNVEFRKANNNGSRSATITPKRDEQISTATAAAVNTPTPTTPGSQKKRRGRPPKSTTTEISKNHDDDKQTEKALTEKSSSSTGKNSDDIEDEKETPKKKAGRPKKARNAHDNEIVKPSPAARKRKDVVTPEPAIASKKATKKQK